MKISVVGLGKLGAPMCAVLASVGYQVIGVDLDQTKVNAINAHRAPVNEPRLEDFINTFGTNIEGTTDLEYAVKNSDVSFIVVLTPSQKDGTFSLKYILPACQNIGRALGTKNEYHVVVITSTIMPGHTTEITKELEHISGKKAGVDFGVCYSPEFIALGSVIENMQQPDMVLIGTDHKMAGIVLEEIYKKVVINSPKFAIMKPVEAELTKIAINTFITTKITYANMLADFCECLPGANVDVVTAAVGMDSRIGNKYLKGGVSFGGPCFPRDNVALKSLGDSLDIDVAVPQEVHNSNERRVEMLTKWIKGTAVGKKVAIIGLTYKIGSEVIEEAAGWKIMNALSDWYVDLSIYDPVYKGTLPIGVRRVTNLHECIEKANLILVMLPYPEVIELDETVWDRTPEQRSSGKYSGSARIVIDCWRVLLKLAKHDDTVVKYLPIGIGGEYEQYSSNWSGRFHRPSFNQTT